MPKRHDSESNKERNERKRAQFAELYGKNTYLADSNPCRSTKNVKKRQTAVKMIKTVENDLKLFALLNPKFHFHPSERTVSTPNPNAAFKAKKQSTRPPDNNRIDEIIRYLGKVN